LPLFNTPLLLVAQMVQHGSAFNAEKTLIVFKEISSIHKPAKYTKIHRPNHYHQWHQDEYLIGLYCFVPANLHIYARR